MKWIICILSVFFSFQGFANEAPIDWMSEYEAGLQAAKSQKKPLIVYFTGSDWCPWCFKIQEEIIDNPEFIDSMKSHYVFVKVDFPKRTLLPEAVRKKNQQLREQFEVKTFPTVVLMDPEEGVISKMGYLDIGGKKYAEQINHSLEEYQMIRKALHKAPKEWDENLERLYEKAKNLGCQSLIEKIYSEGIEKDSGPFFLLEQYANSLQTQSVEESKLTDLRTEIVNRDPENVKGSHRRLAVLDFQSLADQLEANGDPMDVVSPLINYIDMFGKKDKDNIWRLEMMISQYLFSQDKIALALKHARRSYKVAPKAVQKEISDSIIYLKGQLVSPS